MTRQELKNIIRQQLEVRLFKEENNIPGINDDDLEDENSETGAPNNPLSTEPPEGLETEPELPTDGEPGQVPGGDELSYEPEVEPEPEEPTSIVSPDYPAKDSEKTYLPGPEIDVPPTDQSDDGGDVVAAKDITLPEPESEPDYRTDPDQDVPLDAPERDETLTRRDAVDLIKQSKGRIFTVIFTKKDGTDRLMNCRLGVKKYLKGGTLPFDPVEKGLIPVFDIDPKVNDYRLINIHTIKILKIGGKIYNVQ